MKQPKVETKERVIKFIYVILLIAVVTNFVFAALSKRTLLFKEFVFFTIIFAYTVFSLFIVQKHQNTHNCADKVRKMLLTSSKSSSNQKNALEIIMNFCRARSAFIIDAQNRERHSISKKFENRILDESARARLNLMLLTYVSRHRDKTGEQLYIF